MSAAFKNNVNFTPRRRTLQEEADFFKNIHSAEKDVYQYILSYRPLVLPLVDDLKNRLMEANELTPDMEAKLVSFRAAYEQKGALSKSVQRGCELLVDELGDYFRLLEAPRLWMMFVARQVTVPERMDSVEDLAFFVSGKDKASYAIWSKEVQRLYEKVCRAKNDFARDNLGLIGSNIKYAGKFFSAMTYDDLYQEGYFGLMKAIDKFDYTKNYKFSTYGSWWIRHSLQRAVVDRDKIIRIPVHVMDRAKKARSFMGNFFKEHGREPSVDEICKALDFSKELVQEILQGQSVYSLDAPLAGAEEDSNWHAVHADEKAIDSSEVVNSKILRLRLEEAIECLNPRERRVILERYDFTNKFSEEEITLAEIGRRQGLSRERIRQIESEAMKKLRKHFDKEDL